VPVKPLRAEDFVHLAQLNLMFPKINTQMSIDDLIVLIMKKINLKFPFVSKCLVPYSQLTLAG
jgi:hypothetical protein